MDPQIETPKSTVDAFELPCGYLDSDGNLHTHVELRGMTGDEEEVLAAKNMPVMKKLNRILSACTSAIGDIRDAKRIESIIPDLTQGDRVFMLFAIRRVSLGDEFPFATVCPSCEQESRQEVHLSDMEIKKMPDPKIRTYKVTLDRTKHEAVLKVLTGRGEEAISRAAVAGKDVISVAILARMESIAGRPVSVSDLKSLPLADRNQLRDAWQDHEGGVETAVQIQCTNCDHEYEAEIDMASQGFFNPLALRRSWRTKSSF